MQAHGYSSLRYRRLRLVVGCLSLLLLLLIAAPVSAAGSNPNLGSVAHEIIVSEGDLVVDLDPQFEVAMSALINDGSVGALEQETASSASAPRDFGPVGRLESHGESAAAASTSGGLLKQAARYDSHQFLSDDYVDSASISGEAGERYDQRQFLSDDNVDGTLSAGYASGRYDQHQFLSERYVNADTSSDQASERYDRRQFLSDDNIDGTLSAGYVSGRYDQIRFLEDNLMGVAPVAEDNSPTARLDHDTYPVTQSELADSWEQTDVSRIRFLEENWYFGGSSEDRSSLVAEHLTP